MSKKIKKLMEEEGMEQDQAVAVAYKYAKEEGYKVPKNTKASDDTHVGGFEYKTVKIDSPEAKRLQNKGYKVVITNPNLGTVQFEIPKTKASKIEADREQWWKVWKKMGQSMEKCIQEATYTDVNNPEMYCQWLSDVATGKVKASESAMTEYWQMYVDAGLLEGSEEASVSKQLVDKYEASVSKFLEANKEAPMDDYLKSPIFAEFRNDAIKLLTEGVQAGKIELEELDNMFSACRIELSESELNKIVSADPPMPKTKAPSGQKWTKQVDSNGVVTWVLTNID